MAPMPRLWAPRPCPKGLCDTPQLSSLASPHGRLTSLAAVSWWTWEEGNMGVGRKIGGQALFQHPCPRTSRSGLSREGQVLRLSHPVSFLLRAGTYAPWALSRQEE